MFNRILVSAIAASSLAITTPVLAGEGPPFPSSGEDSNSQHRGDTAEQKTSEQISADAPTEGKQVPAAYEDTAAPVGQREPSFFGPTGSELNTFGGG